MSIEDAFSTVHEFFTTKSAPKEALKNLKSGHEIRLLLDGRIEGALFFKDGEVQLEKRECPKADVEFFIGPEAVRLLLGHSGDSVAQLGVDIIKEILTQHVRLRVCGSMLRILSGGYLSIITSGGPEFMGYLASHGLTNIAKITSMIRSLKK